MKCQSWILLSIAVSLVGVNYYLSVIIKILGDGEYPFDNNNFNLATALRLVAWTILFAGLIGSVGTQRTDH